MGTGSYKSLSMIWAVIFCSICGLIGASVMAALQWTFFKFGWYLPESSKAFSDEFWSDFLLTSAGFGAIIFVMAFGEFWKEGIKIDLK